MISVNEALQLIRQNVEVANSESIDMEQSVGRTLAKAVVTDIDSPPYSKSMMDGFAVIASDITSERKRFPVVETVAAGMVPTRKLSAGQVTRIMTGAPMPQGADAIIMVEQADFDESEQTVRFELDSLESGRHLLAQAATMSKGESVLPVGHVIRAQDIGLLAESGASNVTVFCEPSIAVLPTGDELVSHREFPEFGKIRNSNGPMLHQLALAQSKHATSLGVGRDDPNELKNKIIRGLESDVLLLSGGVSAGMLDLVPEVLMDQGVKQVFHKVMVKPGKPIWFGIRKQTDRTQYVFGLPGNPVSSLVGFNLFVRAAMSVHFGGSELQENRLVAATLAEDHEIRGDRLTYWPVHIDVSRAGSPATPIRWQGSSDLRALGQANGLGIFSPASGNSFEAGTSIPVLGLE